MLFLKKRQKNVVKQNSHIGGFHFPGTAFKDESNGTNPPPIGIFLVCGEINKINSKSFQKIGKFHVIFEKTSKKVVKQNSRIGGFYFPGTVFKYKPNGTNPPPIGIFFVCGEINKIISKSFKKIGKF